MNSHRHPSPAKRQGFTLIELLTVIAIIGILAAIIIPTVGKVRQTARAAQAMSNAKQIGMATLLYAQDNRGQLLGHAYDGYAWSTRIWRFWGGYLTKSVLPNDPTIIRNVLSQFADPAIPADRLSDLSYGSGTTWTINVIFNQNVGRNKQFGSGPDFYGNGGRPRIIDEFKDPSRTLYAVSGRGYEINKDNIVDDTLINLNPADTTFKPIYYFHQDRRATPGIFLDGHTKMLRFPIDPKLTQISTFMN